MCPIEINGHYHNNTAVPIFKIDYADKWWYKAIHYYTR